MLSSSTNAFLTIHGFLQRGQFGTGGGTSQEDGFELIHAGVGEEECGVVEGGAGGGGDEFVVVPGDEVVDERLTNFRRGPFQVIISIRG